MTLLSLFTFISIVSFLFFGIACLTTKQMKTEFVRYGLSKYRKLIGILQLLGALGLIFGYYYSTIIHALAALGLAVLMFLGFLVRLKIKDSLIQTLPSLLYAVLNGGIVIMIIDILYFSKF